MIKNKAYIVIILSFFLPVVVCQPQLSSSIGSLELSGEQCPGTLTLTCDAVNFGTGDTINWFVGDDRLAVFDFAVHSIPFTTTTSPNLLNATVQLQSATFSDGQFSYINFTLSASLSDFLSLQRQNITCGSSLMRSSSFKIAEFSVINESSLYPDAVSYTVKYNGLDGILAEIMISWIEMVSSCATNMVSYSVKISNGVIFMRRNFTSEVCSSSQCSYEIDFTQNITSDVILEFYADDNLISTTIIASSTGNNVSVDECKVSIRCSDFNTNENCTINYRQDGMDINRTIPPSSMVSLQLEIELFQVIIKNGSLILQQNFDVLNGAGTDVAAVIVVGAILYLLGLIENLIAYVVWLRKKTKQQAIGLRPWKMLTLIVSTTLVFFVIAVVWVVAFLNTEVYCGTLRSTVIAIHYVALALSVITILISTLILAVVLIVCPSKGKDGVVEYVVLEKSYDFTLGMTEINFDKNTVEGKCPNCDKELSLLVKFAENISHIFCEVCGKRMCSNCQYSKIFVFHLMGFGHACKDCKHVYWEQNKQFANNDDSIGEMSLLWRKKCAEPCSKCNESTDTDLTCDFCGKGICSKNHVRTVTEKKEKTVGNSNKNEEIVDGKITPGMQQNDIQDKDQETSDIETQVNSGEKGQEIAKVGEKGEGLQDKQAKEHQVCRMCCTVCNRKNNFITMKECENIII